MKKLAKLLTGSGLLVITSLVLLPLEAVRAADIPVKGPVYKAAPAYVPSWYFEARIGTAIDPDYDFTINPGGATGTYTPSSGWVGALAVGKYFRPNWRGEIELMVGSGRRGSALGLAHQGSFTSYLLMANAIYEFGPVWRLRPFVGAGLGVLILDTNNLGAVGGAFALNDTDAAFAAAIIAGLDYKWNPRWTATLRYTGVWAGGTTHATTAAGVTVDVHSSFTSIITLGARYAF